MRTFLQRHREQLLGKVGFGFRTVFNAIHGTNQRGFLGVPIQIIVAISDGGKIKRVNRWKEPEGPFRTFVSKADLVSQKIQSEVEHHRKAASPLNTDTNDEYGQWAMKAEEVPVVAEFLVSQHSPLAGRPKPAETKPVYKAVAAKPSPQPVDPACKACGSVSLTGQWGKYGYYWKCNDCSANTPMPTVCSECGAEGHRGKTVRIRKEKGVGFFRECEACGHREAIWPAI